MKELVRKEHSFHREKEAGAAPALTHWLAQEGYLQTGWNEALRHYKLCSVLGQEDHGQAEGSRRQQYIKIPILY